MDSNHLHLTEQDGYTEPATHQPATYNQLRKNTFVEQINLQNLRPSKL